MKTENFEKRKIENKRQERDRKEKRSELFDFENFKISAKKWLIKVMWVFMACVIIFGFFKIIKWGEIFNKNYVEYSSKKEDKILPILIGERKLSEEEILNIKNFEGKLNKIKIKIISLQTSTSTDTFIYNVTDAEDSDFSIKTNFDKNIEDSWNLFVSVYLSEDIKNLEKNRLEYIDIRYTSKVFYKLKDNNLEKKATSTEEIQ